MRHLALPALLALAACSKAPAGSAPHQIHVAGSSAGYLLSTEVAERLMREAPDVLAPLVRAGGTGEGIARFCDADNPTRPDILITTREMTEGERARCAANGSTDVDQKMIGITAIAVIEAKSAAPFPILMPTDIAAALTSRAKTWADIRADLPATPIDLHGPTPTPAIADTLYNTFLQDGQKVRTDGAYTGHGANAELVARAVAAKPGAIGILPLAQARVHQDTLRIQAYRPADMIARGIHEMHAPALSLYLVTRRGDIRHVPGLDRLLRDYDQAIANPDDRTIPSPTS